MPRARAFSMGARRPRRLAHHPSARRAAATQPRNAGKGSEARGDPRPVPFKKQAGLKGSRGAEATTGKQQAQKRRRKHVMQATKVERTNPGLHAAGGPHSDMATTVRKYPRRSRGD